MQEPLLRSIPHDMICISQLSTQTIDIWPFRLDESPNRIEMLTEWLPPHEKTMQYRGVVPEIGIRASVARAGLRRILSRYLGKAPSALNFEIGDHGKPGLGSEPISFNLAHSASLAIVVVTLENRIGVDLELIRDSIAVDQLAVRCFSAGELERWKKLPDSEKLQVFFDIWTRKEAFLKALGDGMSKAMNSIECDLESDSGSGLISMSYPGETPENWNTITKLIGGQARYAICCEGRDHVTTLRDSREIGLNRW